MNVFLVDAGKLYQLDSSVISKRVQDLQLVLSNLADIPLDKQVLLTHDGRSLDASQHLYNYIHPSTPDQPVFLFSKSNIECHIVQPCVPLPQDSNLQERLERYLKDTQTCETLKFGADLAGDYKKYSELILKRTRQLVQDQELQRAGWAAVIHNLDQVTAGFDKRVGIFHDLYDTFLNNRDQYGSMLSQFDEDVKVLAKIPLTKGIKEQLGDTKMIDSIRSSRQHGLGITESMRAPDPGASPRDIENSPLHTLDTRKGEFISLLHWIEAQDSQNSLNSLVLQCSRALDQINGSFLPRVQEDVDKVKVSLQAPGMRDIKGLEERLQQLQNLLGQTERICEEQATNYNSIRNQQESFMVQGDISILSDLLVAHRDQLKRLHANNRSLVEFYTKFSAAKSELSQNLLIRLNWVTHCQKAIWNCDGRLTMISENLVRVKRRFAILEQINIAPHLYCKCLGEISRRGVFTKRYKTWGRNLVSKVGMERGRECGTRGTFHDQIHGHFLTTLFKGLDSKPGEFAAPDALSFDEELFAVSEEELTSLAELFPNYSHLLIPSEDIKKDEEGGSPLYDSVPTTDSACQADLGPPQTTSKMEEGDVGITQKSQELAAQYDRAMKLEVELSSIKEQNRKLEESNRELEDTLQTAQDHSETREKRVLEVEIQLEKLTKDSNQFKQDCDTYQALACEKEAKISTLKTENESFKLQQRSWKKDRAKLQGQTEELEKSVKVQTEKIAEKERAVAKLQRDIESASSDQTLVEQHRIQLNCLRLEIETKKDKEKMFELEKMRLDKDRATQELETKAKLQHGEMEKRHDELADENSKLKGNLVVMQTDKSKMEGKVSEAQAALENERDTTLMYKSEAERDLKLAKQDAAVELRECKDQAQTRISSLQENHSTLQQQNAALQQQINQIRTNNQLAPDQDVLGSSNRVSESLLRELEQLKSAKPRCMEVAVTQFQKGDTVFFYYDEVKCNYLVANVSPNEYQYFLHPDNLAALGLSMDPVGRKPWALGEIKDKEFCQARKQNNRFKVPEGRKFYRVYAQPAQLRAAQPPGAPSTSAISVADSINAASNPG